VEAQTGLFLVFLLTLCVAAVFGPLAWRRWRAARKSPVHTGGGMSRYSGVSSPPGSRTPVAAPPAEAGVGPGKVFAGRYNLTRVVGHGGMGRVWEGTDQRTGERVAVKTMEVKDPALARQLRELYVAEGRTLERLRHPNIVDFLEAVPDGEGVALVFAFVSGKTLQQVLAEKRRLDWTAAREVFIPVARALIAAHAGSVIHRDMKPANIMIRRDGKVKVMDFGVARAIGDVPDTYKEGSSAPAPQSRPSPNAPGRFTREGAKERELPVVRTSTIVGTPAYSPPEAQQGIATPRGDLFSVGVCLYEILTASLPFGLNGWSPNSASGRRRAAELSPGLPPAADALIEDLLQPDLDKRVPDAETLLQRLIQITPPKA